MRVKVGTRGSSLAVTQAKSFLKELSFTEYDYNLVIIKTVGDVRQEEKFTELGVKGIFTKELDEALLNKEIDFAIHSLKDIPSKLHDNIHLAAVSPCLDSRDAFISAKYSSIENLPRGSVVGTSSVRRHAQVLSQRRDLELRELRGNVETRIQKMTSGQYDAILLAASGVKRIGLEQHIRQYLDPKIFVPCVGQGILAATALVSNLRIEKLLKRKQTPTDMIYALLLREFMVKAQGGCSVPLGCHLEIKTDIIDMWGYLSDPEGKRVILEHVSVPMDQKYLVVNHLLEKMEKNGLRDILEEIHGSRS
jgi:hydroxymethylbilane synthase